MALLKLSWKRPQTTEFPKIWRTFKARDLDSDELVGYHIQDLPESRFEDAITHMIANYLKDRVVCLTIGNFPIHLNR